MYFDMYYAFVKKERMFYSVSDIYALLGRWSSNRANVLFIKFGCFIVERIPFWRRIDKIHVNSGQNWPLILGILFIYQAFSSIWSYPLSFSLWVIVVTIQWKSDFDFTSTLSHELLSIRMLWNKNTFTHLGLVTIIQCCLCWELANIISIR